MVVLVDPNDPSRTVLVGNLLLEEEKQEQIGFLKQNLDVFAWTHKDMVGVDPSNLVQCLNVKTTAKPVKQKHRHFAPERKKDNKR